MAQLITDKYKELNADLHSRNPLYGAKAYKQIDNLVSSLGLVEGDTIVDYGCGKATLSRELTKKNIQVINYDPALRMYQKHPSEYEGYPFKYLSCMDVLEHIEPDCLDSVLEDIRDCFTDTAFILISTEGSNKKLSDGRNAHLIIQSRNSWIDDLERTGFKIEKLVDNRKGWLGVVCSK